MIQLREDIAWVRADDGRLAPFDPQRLARSIQLACEFTGHCEHVLSESVASAVRAYVSDCEPIIDAAEIGRIVYDVLAMLACTDVARAYASRHEWVEIRLDEITGFELEFYRQLDAVLRAASGAKQMASVHLCGLRACVMRLRGARRWGTGCRALAEEILDFVRARAAQVRPVRAVALNLEVRE
jgi:hypothetical protein